MFEIWLSAGYILLLVILLFALLLRSTGGVLIAAIALLFGIPLWLGWEYARPIWTTGTISGTELRRSDPDTRGSTRDVQYIYMRNASDTGIELTNEDSWWWLKRDSERLFNDAKTAQERKTEVAVLWNRWHSTLFSSHANAIAIAQDGSWSLWNWRILIFYAGSLVLWVTYFFGFFWLRIRA